MATTGIERHRAALHRNDLSRPLRLAITDGLLRQDRQLFDYGCGHGDDVRSLSALGYNCSGWDPALKADAPKKPSDIVNIGYVVNVIEDAAERKAALQDAWSLASRLLIVAARVKQEERNITAPSYGDGVVTKRRTFQRFFDHAELGEWISVSIGSVPLAAAPGVYYVFRDDTEREAFAASRVRRERPKFRIASATELYEKHADILQPLVDFLAARGRLPSTGELALDAINAAVGSLRRAAKIVQSTIGENAWEEAQLARSEDLLIYLALARFTRRPPFGALSRDLQLDVRAFFSSYERASLLADEILLSVGKPDLIDAACRRSPVGKLTPSALYCHASALADLHPMLRVYEGCARGLVGQIDGANVVKLGRREPTISYLAYPDFDAVAHPPLERAIVVHLASQRVDARDYSSSPNRPILHRKEEFVSENYPLRARFARLTAAEERAGLFSSPSEIGTENGWRRALEQARVSIRGHRLAATR